MNIMTRASFSPVRPAHTFRTITGDDWAQMLRRARADGAADGSALLARLRAKVRDEQAKPVAPMNSRLS